MFAPLEPTPCQISIGLKCTHLPTALRQIRDRRRSRSSTSNTQNPDSEHWGH